jgi:biopolymer transport protein ExbB
MSDKESALQVELKKFQQFTCRHRQTVRSIVVVAPLLGLLGTVIGMIETFESLQDSALFSQSGGIAGGISQALITTQMGLVVAIPGLLLGKKLDRKEESLNGFIGEAVSYESLNVRNL